MATFLLVAIGVYSSIGLLVAVAFVCFGVKRIDAGARGAPVGFFLLIIPGAAALWPLMLGRWLRTGKAP
jgi:hypothetical protein